MLEKEVAMIDPVCGMSVEPDTAAGAWVYGGVTYLFCSLSCLQRFKSDPLGSLALDPSQRTMPGTGDGSDTDAPEGA
jgi:P-type Cu+ transporter